LFVSLPVVVSHTQVVVRFEIIRFQPDCLLKMLYGGVVVTFAGECDSESPKSFGRTGTKAHHSFEKPNRLSMIADFEMGAA
jgi:hypothetical protein